MRECIPAQQEMTSEQRLICAQLIVNVRLVKSGVQRQGWDTFLSNLIGGVTCSYAGQSLVPEFIYEMEKPPEFKKSIWFATILITTVYGIVAATGYALLGSGVQSPITNSLGTGPANIVSQLVLLFHVMIGYALAANSWNTFLVGRVFTMHASDGDSIARLKWLSVTVITASAAAVVAEIVPDFAGFTNLIGSTLSVWITYNIPALCYLRLSKPQGVLRVLIYLYNMYGIFMTIVGTASTLSIMSEQLRHVGVFQCNAA